VEADVLFHVGLIGGDLALLRREQLAELAQLGVGDVLRRERGERRLDDAADLDDVADRVTPRDETLEWTREVVGLDLSHEGAAAGTRLDDAQELERAQRFANRRPRDLELVRERSLGRKLVAGSKLAFL